MIKYSGMMNFQKKNHFDPVKGVVVLGTVIKVAMMLRFQKIMKKVSPLATRFSKSRKFHPLILCPQVLIAMCKSGCKKI
jgi:uncharacterized membrane protein (UPF0136 family)